MIRAAVRLRRQPSVAMAARQVEGATPQLEGATGAAALRLPQAMQRRLGNQGARAAAGQLMAGTAFATPVPAPAPPVPLRREPVEAKVRREPAAKAPPRAPARAPEQARSGAPGQAPAPAAEPAPARAGGSAKSPQEEAPAQAGGAAQGAAEGGAPAAGGSLAEAAAGSAPATTTAQEAAAASPAAAAADQAPPPAAAAAPAEAEAAIPEPPSPREAIAPTIAAVGSRARKARDHRGPGEAAADAGRAAIVPATEQQRGAAVGTVRGIDAAETEKVDRTSFKDQLKKALAAAVPTPRTKEEAARIKRDGARIASTALGGEIASQTQAAGGALQGAAAPDAALSPAAQPAPEAQPLVPEAAGEAPAAVAPDPVVPAPLPPERLDYSADRESTDAAMRENDVSKEQLATANEPDFSATLEAREEGERREAAMPGEFRAAEAAAHGEQRAAAAGRLDAGLGGIFGARVGQLGAVGGRQEGARSAEEAMRTHITSQIEGIKSASQRDVNAILDEMQREAGRMFADGLAAAERDYEAVFEEEKGGFFSWLGGQLTGTWEETVEEALRAGRRAYDLRVSRTIDEVADYVERRLAAAKARVAEGRTQVDTFVAGLDEESRRFGVEAAGAIAIEFDTMESDIDARRTALVDSLVEQYRASRERVDALEQRLRDENKSIWQRIYDATVGVIKKIIEFKNMLLGILARAVQVVGAIIRNPIGFLGNLLSGVKAGLDQFLGNIGTHLKNGLMGWLFGALEGAGLKLPETFDIRGILDLVLQVLGLTKANLRRRLVKRLGEPLVARAEKAIEILTVLFTEGPAGLWRMLMEKLGDIKETLLSTIKDWVITKIITAGIKWVVSLFNPASAFIKACLMIYDVVKFFIERGSQIIALVNAVLDSLAAIVAGNISAMANKIEAALARLVPVAIGFLASLLNLGGISETIRGFIEKLQQPVNAAIDWIIDKAVNLALKIGGAVKGAAEKVVAWWKQRRGVPLPDGEHELSFAGSEASPVLMLASTPRPVQDHLAEAIGDASLPKAVRDRAQKALDFFTVSFAPITGANAPASPTPVQQALIDAIPDNLASFSQLLAAIPSRGGPEPPAAFKVSWNAPTSVVVEGLANVNSTGGEDASAGDPRGWKLITARGLTQRNGNWVRMHMISAGYGGLDIAGNLLPTPTAVNTSGPVRGFEKNVEQTLYGNKKAADVRARPSLFAAALAARPTVLWLETTTGGFHGASAELDPATGQPIYDGATFATSVSLAGGMMYAEDKAWTKDPTVLFSASMPIPPPDFTGTYIPDLNELGEPKLAELAGISIGFARLIAASKPFGGVNAIKPQVQAYCKKIGRGFTDETDKAITAVVLAVARKTIKIGS